MKAKWAAACAVMLGLDIYGFLAGTGLIAVFCLVSMIFSVTALLRFTREYNIPRLNLA